MNKKPIKKPGAFSKKLIIGVFIFLFFFIVACLFVFYTVGSEPVVLIGAVFAICGFECGILGRIKTKKIDNEKQNNKENKNKNDNTTTIFSGRSE